MWFFMGGLALITSAILRERRSSSDDYLMLAGLCSFVCGLLMMSA